MYQLHFQSNDAESFARGLDRLAAHIGKEQPNALFHLYNATNDPEAVQPAVRDLLERFPGAALVGASANGNIVDGRYAQDGTLVVACDVFEDAGSQVEVLQFPLDYDTQHATAQALLAAVVARPDVKAVEMLTTIDGVNMPEFCREMRALPEGIVVFGGGSLNPATDSTRSSVFSSAGEPTTHGIVFVLYRGENLHAATRAMHGWKPLGMPFRITRAEQSTLYELNGKPAFDTYYHYLKIANDEDFSWNSLLFPLAIDHDGMNILRTPVASNDDGSLSMTADISEESNECRIAYGDPTTILQSVEQSAAMLREFQPQAILLFSCASRLLYWGADQVSRETLPFQDIAPAAGFFTGGEFIRHGADLLHHNVTLVVAGLREGDAPEAGQVEQASIVGGRELDRHMAIVGRMASFIGAASRELLEAYRELEVVARTDGLTGLADRRETERLIAEALAEHAARQAEAETGSDGGDAAGTRGEAGASSDGNRETAPALIMLDLDDFKSVNDTYGHEAGDAVLRGLADLLRTILRRSQLEAHAGRWGGEEFMVVVPDCRRDEASALAEEIRSGFAATGFGVTGFRTLSIGVAMVRPGESFDRFCSRVDNALYAAKNTGKNRVVMAD